MGCMCARPEGLETKLPIINPDQLERFERVEYEIAPLIQMDIENFEYRVKKYLFKKPSVSVR